MDAGPRPAPAGFTHEQFETFFEEGHLVLEAVIPPAELAELTRAFDECMRNVDYDYERNPRLRRAHARHSLFRRLINGDRHIGYVYDIYGELSKFVDCSLIERRPGSYSPNYHLDGPTALPFALFSGRLPLRFMVTYWLTEVDGENMGNYAYLPGSHRDGTSHPDRRKTPERVLTCPAGSISIINPQIWHRVLPSEDPRTRKSVFLTYSPSWLSGRFHFDPGLLEQLDREQRILVRPYEDNPQRFIQPAMEEFPLFLDRETGETPEFVQRLLAGASEADLAEAGLRSTLAARMTAPR